MTVTSDDTVLRHSLLEDALAFVIGTSLCALGLMMLAHLGLITGQTAGLGVLLSYVTGWSFGPIFFVINLPFYLLAFLRMGAGFTLRSFIAVGLLSAATGSSPEISPLIRAICSAPWVSSVYSR